MRILLDESVPEKLGKLLAGHTCSTVQRQGWASIKNGKLLALAKDQFDLLLTADKGMEYQQNQDTCQVPRVCRCFSRTIQVAVSASLLATEQATSV